MVSLGPLMRRHHGCWNIFVLSFLKDFAAKRARTAWTCFSYEAECFPVAFRVQVSQTKGSLRCGAPPASFDVLVITFFGVLWNGSGVTAACLMGNVKLHGGKRVRNRSVKVLCKHSICKEKYNPFLARQEEVNSLLWAGAFPPWCLPGCGWEGWAAGAWSPFARHKPSGAWGSLELVGAMLDALGRNHRQVSPQGSGVALCQVRLQRLEMLVLELLLLPDRSWSLSLLSQ